MKHLHWLLLVLAIVILPYTASALTFSTTNLVENGGFEDGDSPWTFDSGTGVSTERPYAGSFGVKMLNDSDYWGSAEQSITYFKGRTYYYTGRFAGTGYIQNNRMYLGGTQIFSQTGYSSGGWKTGYGQYAVPGSGVATDLLKVTSSVGTGANNQTAYWDTVSLKMERSIPDPNHDSEDGILVLGEPTTVSIYSLGGGGTYRIAFDPDITVSSEQAEIGTVSWVSDTQIDVEVTAITTGNIDLVLRNEYSDLEDVHSMTAYFDGPFTFAEDNFPIVMMGMATHTGGFDDVVAAGCDYIHTYGIGPRLGQSVSDAIDDALAFMDLAYGYGLRVMVGINAAEWWDQANAVSIVQQYVNGVKDHPALGFWYLADEPEFKAPGSSFEPLYNAIKAITPDVPVANAHCQCTNWNTFDDAEDISMPDNYPVLDQAYPTAPIQQTTTWTRTHLQRPSGNEVMPIMQSYNRRYDSSCTGCEDYRFPTVEELRYWAYGNLVQGVRGITWYCYWCARSLLDGNQSIGYKWLQDIFIPTNADFSTFTKLISPAHEGQLLMDGQSGDDNIYAGFWERSTGLWLVVVNNSSSARTLTVDASSVLTNAGLEPWGMTRGITAAVEQGQLTIDALPWETLVFQAKLPADINSDDYVDTVDLSSLADQWLESTDPAN